MSNNLSRVFKDAKKFLWDGTHLMLHDDDKEEYICYAIGRTAHSRADQEAATAVILSMLGWSGERGVDASTGWRRGKQHSVTSYLTDVVGASRTEVFYDHPKVQKYRRDWLTSLEKEFK